jgi:hypothetical protein
LIKTLTGSFYALCRQILAAEMNNRIASMGGMNDVDITESR